MADSEFNQSKILELPSLIVGVDDKLSVLCDKLKRSPIVGLVGVGGVGKTTLSKIMYNSELEHYERCSYLEDVKSYSNIVDFQKQLLQELCYERWDDRNDSNDYLGKIQECIKTNKVLVVIDDVGTEQNLKALHVRAFQEGSSGSKLIITCRNQAILKDYMSEGEMIEVDALGNEQAMALFSRYAFNAILEIGSEERARFETEAVNIVSACGGLPLIIEVIGQHLCKQNHLPNEKQMDMWKEVLRRLKEAMALDGHDNEDERLWRKLRISYDDLGDLEKGFFLDFACILCDMKDIGMDSISRIWDFEGGLQTLIDRSLVKVASKLAQKSCSLVQWDDKYKPPPIDIKKLVIHDQLRDMGRWIAKGLDKSGSQKHEIHMWENNEIIKFFEDNETSSTLEGLSLVGIEKLWPHQPQILQALTNKILQFLHIQQFPNLRLLNLFSSRGDVVKYIFKICSMNPQNLRWLCLNNTGQYSYNNNIGQHHLINGITSSHLKTLGAKFKELRVLHMRSCWTVYELPSSILELSALKELDLKDCLGLKTLPGAIGKLVNLQVLILQHCVGLKQLPESIGDLVQLSELDLSECWSLTQFPSTLGNLKSLKLLNLRNCAYAEAIPAEVGQLIKLESLDLNGWQYFNSVSLTMCDFDSKMHHLHTLNLYDCKGLKSFRSLGNLYRLRRLSLNGCRNLCIPNLAESVGQLTQLQYLNLKRCDSMAEEIVETLEKGQLRTDHLEFLSLSAIPETALPSCPQLKFLYLASAKPKVQQIELSKPFSESLGNLMQLQVLDMEGISSVPESVGNLTQLQELYVARASNLPDALSKLVGLRIAHFRYLSCERLSKRVGDLVSLRELLIVKCKEMVKFPVSLGRLTQLRTLELWSSKKLERLPDSLGELTQLRSLNLSSCRNLERLPESLAGLTQLSKLGLYACYKLEWKEASQHAMLKQLHDCGCKITLPRPSSDEL